MHIRGDLDLPDCVIDGTFIEAKKGICVETTKHCKATKLLAVADHSGLPFAVCTASALPHEVKPINAVLAAKFVNAKPVRLVSDRSYDSGPLDESLNTKDIEFDCSS